MLGSIVKVIVDRPKGSCHPEWHELRYPINYGFVENTMAFDGEEIDAYILGVDEPINEFTGKVVAIIHRMDDVEDKLVVAPHDMSFTRDEIEEITIFQEQYFKTDIEL